MIVSTTVSIAFALVVAAQAPTPPDAPAESAAPPPAPAPATTAAPAPAPEPAPASTPSAEAEAPKILVLDFRDDGVGASAVRVIHDTLVTHLAKNLRLDVLSSEDVRQAVAREAERRESTNCDEEGCIAEIAEALGAQLTIYGTAGKLGDLVVVNVNLYDARNARSVGRETIEVSSLEALPGPLRHAGDKLIAQLFGETVSDGPTFGPLFWTGVGVAGAGLVTTIVGGSVYFANVSAVTDATTFQGKTEAKTAQDLGRYAAITGLGVLGVGVVVTAASFALE